MPVAEGSTLIHAPVEVVYNYLANPNNLPTMLRANLITEISGLEAKPDGGCKYEWQYKILGKSIRSKSETAEMIPCHTFTVKSTGGIDTISCWQLEPAPEETVATFSIEYAMDNTVLSWRRSRRWFTRRSATIRRSPSGPRCRLMRCPSSCPPNLLQNRGSRRVAAPCFNPRYV